MKALSILQPWAEIILRGDKRVENRTWRRNVTGTILVHTGKKYDLDSEPFIIETCSNIGRALPNVNVMRSAPRGALIGVMGIRACVSPLEAKSQDPEMADWAFGPWCFMLDWMARFKEPIPYRGELGFFEVPDEIVRAAVDEATTISLTAHV